MSIRREKYEDAEDYLLKAARVVSPNEKKRLAQEFEVLGDKFLRAGKNKDAVRAFRQALTLDKEKLTLANKLAKAKEN
jgi:Tfp pilus assembly protein PilF